MKEISRRKGWLVCYDIAEARARRRCFKMIRNYSSGYQKSCFELVISHSELLYVIDCFLLWIDPDTDRLLLVAINSFSSSWQAGSGPISPTGPLIIVQ